MTKTRREKYDYGECDICDTHMEERRVKQDFWIRGKLLVVENVPAGVCPKCGQRVVKADVGRRIGELIRNTERIARAPKISVPSIRFHAGQTQ